MTYVIFFNDIAHKDLRFFNKIKLNLYQSQIKIRENVEFNF